MQPNSNYSSELTSGATAFGLALSATQITHFQQFEELLYSWNEKINLTRIPRAKALTLHFLDSLSIAKAVDLSGSKRLVDIGTGAGFPGLPLKIALPDLQVTLVDSLLKRVRVIDTICAEIGLTFVESVHARAEQLASERRYKGQFDCVTARAVAELKELIPLLAPFVKTHGKIVVMKSQKCDEEVLAAKSALKKNHIELIETHQIELPGEEVVRKLLVLGKI